jgi:hypothetical protein
MSIKVMSWVWEHGPDGPGELLVLLALANFADDDGACWPSIARVAHLARMSERNARRVIRKLELGGYLTVELGGGRAGANRFESKPGQFAPRTICPPGHPRHRNPDTSVRPPGHLRPKTRTQLCPPNRQEPSKEPLGDP